MARFFQYLHEHAEMVKRSFFVVLALAVILDFFVERHTAHFFGDRIYGFWSIFGLIGCLTMICLCKWLFHAWLGKDEEYYDN